MLHFTFHAEPLVETVTPSSGPQDGGTAVTVVGRFPRLDRGGSNASVDEVRRHRALTLPSDTALCNGSVDEVRPPSTVLAPLSP